LHNVNVRFIRNIPALFMALALSFAGVWSQPVLARPAAIPVITAVEPNSMSNASGGTLTLIGGDIITGTVIRLVGYGVLTTEYVNAGSIRGAVPIGLNPQRYPIELIEPDGTAYGTPFVLDIVGLPATPAPTSLAPTVVPGKPLVALRNFTLDPPKPIAGREFTLTVELYNTGSRGAENTLVTFPGGTSFTPVGDNGYLLGAMGINATARLTQRFRVPQSLQSQIYELKFNISANDWSGENFQFPQTIPVEVIGIAPGRPQLVIERARTEPPVLRAGEPFSLVLTLANRGNRAAVSTLASLVPLTDVLPIDGGNFQDVGFVGVGHTCDITLTLGLAPNAGGGRRPLDINFDFTDFVGTQTYNTRQSISVIVSDATLGRAQLVLTGYQTEPRTPSPGELFTLTWRLSNVGGGDARRVIASLGGENGANLKPFAPVNSSNVTFIPQLKAGETFEAQQTLIADNASESGAFNLPVLLAYDDASDQRRTEQQVMSLLLRRTPLLRVTFSPPVQGAMVNQPVQLPVEIVNIGRRLVNINVVELTSDQIQIQGGSVFAGPLDGGSSVPIPAQGFATVEGPTTVTVTINYIDELNQAQQLVRTLTVNVDPAPPGPPPGETPPTPQTPGADDRPILVRLLSALFGLGS
jgi:hypothetical protein